MKNTPDKKTQDLLRRAISDARKVPRKSKVYDHFWFVNVNRHRDDPDVRCVSCNGVQISETLYVVIEDVKFIRLDGMPATVQESKHFKRHVVCRECVKNSPRRSTFEIRETLDQSSSWCSISYGLRIYDLP